MLCVMEMNITIAYSNFKFIRYFALPCSSRWGSIGKEFDFRGVVGDTW